MVVERQIALQVPEDVTVCTHLSVFPMAICFDDWIYGVTENMRTNSVEAHTQMSAVLCLSLAFCGVRRLKHISHSTVLRCLEEL